MSLVFILYIQGNKSDTGHSEYYVQDFVLADLCDLNAETHRGVLLYFHFALHHNALSRHQKTTVNEHDK